MWMVETLHRRPMTRNELAMKWEVTPRAVSYLIDTARDAFGVRIEHTDHAGYELRDPGVFSLVALRRRKVEQ
jgi:DNA-binding transcriptional regulator LsrR (DeoR family)